MKLTKTELKKILYDFNGYSNNLLQSNFSDYQRRLVKFINFIDNTNLIRDYIKSCGECEQNLPNEFEEVIKGHGQFIFSIGETEAEEVRNIYAILSYIIRNKVNIIDVILGYSGENTRQSKLDGFNKDFVSCLIEDIERYITKIGIDMGLDDNIEYNINNKNGQLIINSENVNANYITGIDQKKLEKLITNLDNQIELLSEKQKKLANRKLKTIKQEIKKR